MKKELEVFENRSDDWLGKEIAEEKRKSVWDFDDGRKLKAEHQERHESYNEKYGKGVINQNINKNTIQKKVTVWPFVILMIMIISFIFQVESFNPFGLIPLIMFMVIIISLLFSKGGKK